MFRFKAAARLDISVSDLEKDPEDQIRDFLYEVICNWQCYLNETGVKKRILELCKEHNFYIDINVREVDGKYKKYKYD